ncbi:hypothetical protein BHE74_00039460, partial [Ensete ventricosum]
RNNEECSKEHGDCEERNPVVGEEEADKPEEDVDVGEKEDVGEEERVVEAPTPEVVGRGRGGRGAAAVVVEEGEVEEEGRERGEKGNGGVLEASHGDFFRGWVDRAEKISKEEEGDDALLKEEEGDRAEKISKEEEGDDALLKEEEGDRAEKISKEEEGDHRLHAPLLLAFS